MLPDLGPIRAIGERAYESTVARRKPRAVVQVAKGVAQALYGKYYCSEVRATLKAVEDLAILASWRKAHSPRRPQQTKPGFAAGM